MTQKVDRRVRKTKAALRAGLIKLMQTKSIREITVRELVEEVDINRSTFYLHYTDIYDMLNKIEQELIDQLIDVTLMHKKEYYNDKVQVYLEEVFTILLENVDICYLLIGPNGDLNFINNMKNLIKENITQTTVELLQGTQSVEEIEFAVAFYMGGCVGILEKWLMGGAKETPKELSTLCYKLLRNGLVSYIPEF
ncbi:MAG: TetR-like C-terminal domain-containing protein [bacterium]|nr:TetR-like C-terminal domain-containing protein [bacterium]